MVQAAPRLPDIVPPAMARVEPAPRRGAWNRRRGPVENRQGAVAARHPRRRTWGLSLPEARPGPSRMADGRRPGEAPAPHEEAPSPMTVESPPAARADA